MWFPLRVTKACVLIPARLDPGFAPASELKQVKHTEIAFSSVSQFSLCVFFTLFSVLLYIQLFWILPLAMTLNRHTLFLPKWQNSARALQTSPFSPCSLLCVLFPTFFQWVVRSRRRLLLTVFLPLLPATWLFKQLQRLKEALTAYCLVFIPDLLVETICDLPILSAYT